MGIDFLKAFIVGFCGSVAVGPIGVLCIQRTINKGKHSGFMSGAGAASADTLFAALAVFCLAAVQSLLEHNQAIFYIAGGAIIAWIGIKIHFSNPIKQLKKPKISKFKLLEDFASTFLLTLTNPMTIFFLIGLFALVKLDLTTRTNTSSSVTIVLLGVFLGACLWWTLLISIVNKFRKKFRLRKLWLVNKIAGIIIFILGVISVFEGIWTIIYGSPTAL
ncbi:MAG: LysE family translocator [Prevotellaceae bacterium]|jgi:threonine/homoserine/homoserine lactone efflux protein|nr:LysE family translocator [Prevotellaceae bacterium]